MHRTVLGLLLALFATPLSFAATLLQQEAGTFAFEAEAYTATNNANWSTISTTTGVVTLPDGSNAVGDAIYNSGGGGLSSFVTYDLQFTHDGTYYLYTRYSMYDRVVNDAASYGNEDSFYLPRDLSVTATSGGEVDDDWYNQVLSSQGHRPANHADPNPNEGMFFYWDELALSGVSTPHTYIISGASEENPLDVTFTISNREGGVALDRFVFSTTRLNGGTNSTLDGIASVPEPSRALLSFTALGFLLIRRRR